MLFTLWSDTTEREFTQLSLPGPQSGVNSEPIYTKTKGMFTDTRALFNVEIVKWPRHWVESQQQQRRLEDFQFTHLPLCCRLSDDGNQGGIKTTKLNLFTVGGLHSASLCEKYVGKILPFWKYEKRKRNISGYQPSQLKVYGQPPSVPGKCSRWGTAQGHRQVTEQNPGYWGWMVCSPAFALPWSHIIGLVCVSFPYFAHLVSWVCSIFSKECLLKDRTFFNAIVTQTNLESTYILSNHRSLVP